MTLEKAKKEMVKFVERKTTLRPEFVDPILNAVEVVRCKDCKYYDANCPYPVCVYLEVNADGNDFCSWGERREDGKI